MKLPRYFALTFALTSSLSVAGCMAVLGISSDPVVNSDGGAAGGACTTNAQCIAQHGANWICRKSDSTCQGLINDDCKTVLGSDNLKDDDTFLIGALFAVNGANAAVGKGETAALSMAFTDFAPVNGLPPVPGSTKRRGLAVLVCDDSSANEVALRSVTHMTKDLGIQGIIGPSWSGPTINFLTKQSIPAGALVVASGTTSPDFTNLQKNGLYFRTCESTAIEAPALAKVSQDIETALNKVSGLAGNVKVALAYKGDSFGKGTSQVLLQSLTVGGKPALDPANSEKFLSISYGNPADPAADPTKYPETAAKIVALAPQIVILIGTSEAQANVMSVAEQTWPAGVRKPYWIYSHSQVSSAIVTQLTNSDPTGDLRKRIMGVTFGSNTPTYAQFRSNFSASQPADVSPDSIFANTTYDAFYTIVYAATAAGGKPLTGANLSEAMAQLVPPGQKINIGPGEISQALSLLASGQKVDLVGSSGPLDFNLQTGDVLQENQVWCIPLVNGAPGFPTFSGYGFDLAFNATGSLDSLNTKCGVSIGP